MRGRLGLHEAASAALEEALPLARSLGSRTREVEVLLDTAMVWDWREDFGLAETLVEQAEQLASGLRSPILEVRLTLGRARSAFRRLVDPLAICEVTVAVAEQALALGPEGYETAVAALLIAAPLHAYRGEYERSAELFEQLLRLCEEHNDSMHLTMAYNNRAAGLWFSLRNESRLVSDFEQVLTTARTFGFTLVELLALCNLAEVNYVLANYERCIEFTELALEEGERLSSDGLRVMVSLLLLARCRLVAGELAEAERLVRKIREMQAIARSEDRTESEWAENYEVLCRAIELSTTYGTDEQWESLSIRAAKIPFQNDDVEVLELRGLASERKGDPATAARMFSLAADRARSQSSLIEGRIRARIASLGSLR